MASVKINRCTGELPDVPMFHCNPESLVSAFEKSIKYIAGEFVDRPLSDFTAYLRNKFPSAKIICSAIPEYAGNRKPEDYANWAQAGHATFNSRIQNSLSKKLTNSSSREFNADGPLSPWRS